jgi:hypothetical protein
LSRAYVADPTPAMWETAARGAKRQAYNLAVAIDGLTDRCAEDLGRSKPSIRASVAKFCVWPGTSYKRPICLERIRGVANAYKHRKVDDPNLPIFSEDDVLVVSLGYGLEVYGVGKMGFPEVLVRSPEDKKNPSTQITEWKFLGDVPPGIHGWMRFLTDHGVMFSNGPYRVCNLQVHP